MSRHAGGLCCASSLHWSTRMSDEQEDPMSSARELVEAGGGKLPQEGGGSMRTALANAMVGMKKQFYGRGPTAAKAWILDDYVFVAMEGGLTRNEETLLAGCYSAAMDLAARHKLASIAYPARACPAA